MPPDEAAALWEELVVAGGTPAGLGARDTLRLEVNYCLYGNELTEDRNPIEADLGWRCKEETGFVGSEAVRRSRAEGTAELLAAFVDQGRRHPPAGQSDPRRRADGRRGDQRHLLALARGRDRDGVRARRARRTGDRDRDRRPRPAPRGRGSRSGRSTPGAADGKVSARWPTRAIPRISATTPSTTGPGSRRQGHLRDHLVRAGRARRGRLLRSAGGRHRGEEGRALHRGRVGEGRLRRELAALG